MINAENALEFNIIKEKMKEYALTESAKKEIDSLMPCLLEREVRLKLHETTEAKIMLEKCGNPPITGLTGISELIEVARKGGCLLADQLESIATTLISVRRLKDYLNNCKKYDIGIAYYEENMDSLDSIIAKIGQEIRNGRVDDFASKLLKSLRGDIDRIQSKMREKADSVIRSNKECMADIYSTMRNGHICIPVKKEYKFKISGMVLDKSSTGNTLFIEPTAITQYYGELQELKIDEENEERRILYTMTAMLSDKLEIVEQNNRTIEKLDFIFAKAKLSSEYDGIEASINTDRFIRLKNARHPLMDKKINVPLNFEIGNGIQGVIITGPNTGGKTVAIKTVALNCMMAQCGLHIPAETAEICMNSDFLCDIGDGQNISENLSTFSAHITNVLDILKRVNRESLVIMDELGSGTDPAEGMGIAIAILDELKKSRALFLVTTHYPEIKEYARQEEEIVNARMTFDRETLRPLYQLIIGEAGESCALYIAGKLGMPRQMLERAALAAYGDSSRFDLSGIAGEETLKKASHAKIEKNKKVVVQEEGLKHKLGDSVLVMPEKKIGIVCETVNEKGVLRLQMATKKIYINHKRVKPYIAATELYPPDYDFSIIFESVKMRKLKHQMERKYTEEQLEYKDE